MKKLINMTDFVLEQLNEENSRTKPIRNVLNSLENYANFLKRPLELEMFVPVDEERNVYVDYKVFNYAKGTICVPYEGLFEIKANEKCKGWKYLNEPQEHKEDQRYYDSISYKKAALEYQKAKEKVLFEGFIPWGERHVQNRDVIIGLNYKNGVFQTIEDLILYTKSKNKLQLTESAIKQLWL